jgi:cytochrome c oxidase subunit 3
MSTKNHPYHILELSPWPLLVSMSLLLVLGGSVALMHAQNTALLLGKISFGVGMFILVFALYYWWSDTIKEGRVDRAHNNIVATGLKLGMLLFILSEICFFGVFFISFFKYSLYPVGGLDANGLWVVTEGSWPPHGIQTFDPWHLPFLNTLILLLSGTTVTWAHHAILHDNQKDAVTALALTVFLGLCFTTCQIYEYYHAAFAFTDGIYASNF